MRPLHRLPHFLGYSWSCRVTAVLRLVASGQDEDYFLSNPFLRLKLCHSSGVLSNWSVTLAPQNMGFISGLNLSHSSLSPWCFFMSVLDGRTYH